ncbi:DNA repair protein, putative [Plasmodium sp. gorilla clade G2]|uniref:DNA repair protein, putative n=1 Tax=Plasmodium sp. gorilla clade G2 TaxID=880535 RepID=UPI000D228BD8|nr:DNA repair protein, putative [Plasmodium sp. gorilla clade G2]SOV12963.1 DNA repair protein, putative [Plasmodium sp. gorilla clade G2]
MIHSDESQNDEEKVNYNNILFENNISDEIDYFDDRLPHINFYLKFQKKDFMQNFFDKVSKEQKAESDEKKIEILINPYDIHDIENENKYEDTNMNDIINDNEGGFLLDNDEDDDNNNLYIINNNNSVPNDCLSLDIKDDIFHLDDQEEYTKKINENFQKNKNEFIFSIERVIENEEEENIKTEKCFLCNKKKKNYNETLVHINIYLCKECKALDSNFRMISLTKLIKKYSLNTYDLSKYEKQLALLSTKNPRGYMKQMKLYFIFQIKEIALRKHGSLLTVKNLYNNKLLNINSSSSTNKINKTKKLIHKFKKTKTIFSKQVRNMEQLKIICEDNEHDFDIPVCINQNDNTYNKKCKKCSYCVEYMQF